MKRLRPLPTLLLGTHLAAIGIAYYCGYRHHGTRDHRTSASVNAPAHPMEHPGEQRGQSTSGLAAQPPAAATASAGYHHNLLAHLQSTEIAIRHLSADQLLKALQDLSNQPTGPEKLFSQQLMLTRLTEMDPALALSVTSQLPSPENLTGELSVLSTWSRLDPASAAAFFQENSSDFGVFDARQRAAARTIAEQWSQTDPLEAFEWASRLPEEVRLDALAPAISQLSLNQSDRIIEAINQREPGAERTEMIAQVAGERAQHAPHQTAEWATQLTELEERDSATAAVVSRWAKQDLRAAAQWVRSLSPGASRDAALRALLDSSAFRRDPSAAMQWTTAIRDEAVRRETIASIVNRWEVLDPDAAAGWTKTHGHESAR
jgi:hypothetical protein